MNLGPKQLLLIPLLVGAWCGPLLAFLGFSFLSVINVLTLLVFTAIAIGTARTRNFGLSSDSRPTIILLAPLGLFLVVVMATSLLGTENPLWELKRTYPLWVGLAVCLVFAFSATGESPELLNAIVLFLWSVTIGMALYEISTGDHLPGSRSAELAHLRFIPTAFFHNPNDLGSALVLILPFLWVYNLHKGRRLMVIGLLVASAGILSVIASRGALLTFVVSMVLVVFTSVMSFRKALAAATVAIGIFLAFPTLQSAIESRVVYGRATQGVSERFFTRMGTIDRENRPKDSSFSLRLHALRETSRYLSENTFGMGLEETDRFLGEKLERPLFNPHSLWLELLLAWGLLGFTCFVAFWLGLVLEMYQLFRRSPPNSETHALARASLISLLALVIVANVPSSVLRGFHMIWFPFALAILTATRAKLEPKGSNFMAHGFFRGKGKQAGGCHGE